MPDESDAQEVVVLEENDEGEDDEDNDENRKKLEGVLVLTRRAASNTSTVQPAMWPINSFMLYFMPRWPLPNPEVLLGGPASG